LSPRTRSVSGLDTRRPESASAVDAVWSESAGENGVGHIQLNLFFASAMFFAVITASFGNRHDMQLLLAGASSAQLAVIGLHIEHRSSVHRSR